MVEGNIGSKIEREHGGNDIEQEEIGLKDKLRFLRNNIEFFRRELSKVEQEPGRGNSGYVLLLKEKLEEEENKLAELEQKTNS